MVVDFAKRIKMTLVNTYLENREERSVTFKKAEQQIVEADKGELLSGLRGEVKTGSGWL